MTEGQVKKQTQVDEQGEYLQTQIAQLVSAIDTLESRLERVLAPLKPKEEKEGIDVDLVPFADFLRNQAWSVQAQRNRVISILERLEL